VDIGINLAHPGYAHDRAAVLERAAAAGVVHLVVTGSSVDSSRAARAYAHADRLRLSATAGVHPHHASELDTAALGELRALLATPEVVAAGECGLDYYRDLSPRADQQRALRAQIELAIEARKPLFLHQRDAHTDFVAILAEYGASLPRAVAHCFTGSRAEAEQYLRMGLAIGITGWICDERRGLHLREVVRAVPADRLMLETDGPYLLPRTLARKPATRRNEPMYLGEVCRAVASAREQSYEQTARATSQTAAAFFGFALPELP
jgi:TatD DNase family protein